MVLSLSLLPLPLCLFLQSIPLILFPRNIYIGKQDHVRGNRRSNTRKDGISLKSEFRGYKKKNAFVCLNMDTYLPLKIDSTVRKYIPMGPNTMAAVKARSL